MQRRSYDPGDCELVVITRDGPAGRALDALSAIGRFRSTPYPGVIAGRVSRRELELPERTDAQKALLVAACRHPEVFSCVQRATPLDVIVPFERDDVTETLCCALSCRADAIHGRSFHVRARLRGFKGRVESHAVERALGGFLCDRARAAKRPATVTFDDPDVILMVQVLGHKVGFAFLEREVRALDFVRPR